MTGWNFDMACAPRGKYVVKHRKFGAVASADTKVFEPDLVILASKCGVVTVSSYLPDEKRWNMFAVGEEPIAWHPMVAPRIETLTKGKTRSVIDLPTHPTVPVSWFKQMLEAKAA